MIDEAREIVACAVYRAALWLIGVSFYIGGADFKRDMIEYIKAGVNAQ